MGRVEWIKSQSEVVCWVDEQWDRVSGMKLLVYLTKEKSFTSVEDEETIDE